MKNNPIKITNSRKGPTVVEIEGMIGVPEEWQFENPAQRISTYHKFQRTIDDIKRIRAAEVIVNIRSTGGNAEDALMIYDALAELAHQNNASVTTRCHGYAASAATIIAQAASAGKREIAPGALYLVHNSTAGCEGTADEMRTGSEMLAKTDQRIAAIYAEKSGRDPSEFATLMAENSGNGRWLSPDEAIEAGLADKLCGPAGDKLCRASSDKLCGPACGPAASGKLCGPAGDRLCGSASGKLCGLTGGRLCGQEAAPTRKKGLADIFHDAFHDKPHDSLPDIFHDAFPDKPHDSLPDMFRDASHDKPRNSTTDKSTNPRSKNTTPADAEKWQHQNELARLHHRIATLESENAQLQAVPTVIKTKEDPAPNSESRRSANANAYQTDAENLFR